MDKFLKALQLVNLFGGLIIAAEQAKVKDSTLSGDEKRKLVMDQITLSISTSGIPIANTAEFNKQLNKAVDGVVGMLNASVWAK